MRTTFPKLLLTLLFCIRLFPAESQVITSFIGDGVNGYSGDGGPSTQARIFNPQGICADQQGNIYVTDHGNHVVRKVNALGIITTIAGNGSSGNSGDGGPATAAQLKNPYGVTIDGQGNLYIADQMSYVIRKVAPTGIISTVAGKGSWGYKGDGGPAINAEISPCGITCDDKGNLYFADFSHNVIRKIDASGIITTVAGNGSQGFLGNGGPAVHAQLNGPTGVAVDKAGNMYIADMGNCRIQKVAPNGIITTIAGGTFIGYSGDGGPAVNAQLKYPYGVFVDGEGNLYICDTGNNVVRKINSSGIITTVAGNGTTGYSGDGGPPTSAQVNSPGAFCTDLAGNMYITSTFVVRKVGACRLSAILANPKDATICNSGNTELSVEITGQTGLQWQVNDASGWHDIQDNTIYTGARSSLLKITGADGSFNGLQYRCLVSNACGTINSLPATLNVTTVSDPSITISGAVQLCQGEPASYTTSITNGGDAPHYQWYLNDLPTGNNPGFSVPQLTDGDRIRCVLTSSSGCVTAKTATSNELTIRVSPNATPRISIKASATTFCAGTRVFFTADGENGGASARYQWQKNGVSIGTNSSSWADDQFRDGDQLQCLITSSLSCVSTATSASNVIKLDVIPLVTPAVSISASKSSYCFDETIQLTATPLQGGTNPTFFWEKNGQPVNGNNSGSLSVKAVQNGDVFACTLTSNAGCTSAPTAKSNSLPIKITPKPVLSLDPTPTLCSGSNRILSPGSFAAYLWQDGSTQSTYLVRDTGSYRVTVTDGNGCRVSDSVRITGFLANPKDFLPGDDSLCSYGALTLRSTKSFQEYRWSSSALTPSIEITRPGVYWLEVTDNHGCVGRDSIKIYSRNCLQGFFIPSAFTPNRDGKNDVFLPKLFGVVKKYRFTIYNRWGQVVFQTSEVQKGWDGKYAGVLQNGSVFVWTCVYQLEGAAEKYEKGSVTLIE